MNVHEKTIVRQLFQNKVFKSDGQSFEDIFTNIMDYSVEDFRSIKPWGNIGDRKNDGYIKSKGIFFQVYAPEDIRKSYVEVVNKIKTDFSGLLTQWEPIHEFYFVVNDKYKGVNADCEQIIQEIKKTHNLRETGILTAKDLENTLFSLESDQILTISGFIPDPAELKLIDYSILNEIIGHIMELPLEKNRKTEITLPDWFEKITFNDLSAPISYLLNNGYFQLSNLDKYLANNSDFLADTLRNHMNEVYNEEKQDNHGDDLFWAMVSRLSPREEQIYQTIVIVIMAKYFETCDIFEEPTQEEEK